MDIEIIRGKSAEAQVAHDIQDLLAQFPISRGVGAALEVDGGLPADVADNFHHEDGGSGGVFEHDPVRKGIRVGLGDLLR